MTMFTGVFVAVAATGYIFGRVVGYRKGKRDEKDAQRAAEARQTDDWADMCKQIGFIGSLSQSRS